MSKCKNRADNGWNITDLHDNIFDQIRWINGRATNRSCIGHDEERK